MPDTPLTDDHTPLADTLLARAYFAAFDRILPHLGRVAGELEHEGRLTRTEARLIAVHLTALAQTFRALSLKYLMTGRTEGPLPGAPVFDRHDSGFPVAQELMVMANDALQAGNHLAGLAPEAELKDRMIRQMLRDLVIPTDLQFALSQRLYYQMLQAGGLFWPRNDPVAQWLGEDGGRRRWLLSWAVYDGRQNLPVIWLMQVDDTGRTGLATDARRWPAVQAHLMAQSLSGLKLLTVAQGFDTDFDTLHPRTLRRLTVGPLHSAAFTLQTGPLGPVLDEARGAEGQDWALVWTDETLVAQREETVKDGWFSSSLRQVYALDPLRGADTGASRIERMAILPERVFQILTDRDPPGFRDVRKFVVGAGGRLIAQR